MILISNKKYKEALERCERYRRELEVDQSRRMDMLKDIAHYKDKCYELEMQLHKYKEKYLDEQQKRLFLAELIKKLEGESEEKPVTCRECKYLVYDPSYVHCTKGHNKSMSSLEYSCGEGEKRL